MKRGARELTCREVVDFLAEYIDGGLDPAERVLFDRHLAECPECVAYMRSYAVTIRLMKGAFRDPDGPVPPEVPDELVRAILAARAGPRRRRRV